MADLIILTNRISNLLSANSITKGIKFLMKKKNKINLVHLLKKVVILNALKINANLDIDSYFAVPI